MIGYLSGELIDVSEQHAVVNVGGVGYEVYIGKSPCFDLPHVGGHVKVWIHTHVREDQISLFGFNTSSQRKLFVMLTSITGVGPKLGYALIGQFDEASLISAIASGDAVMLKSVPGVGNKMAERILLELREKIGGLAVLGSTMNSIPGSPSTSVWGDLIDAMLGLGFPEQRVKNVVRLLQTEHASEPLSLDQLVKTALQKINSC